MSLPDIFISRRCKASFKGGPVENLDVHFHRPEKIGSEEYVVRARIVSSTCDTPTAVSGADEVQALALALDSVLSRLRGMTQREGWEIYWVTPGDLDSTDFWSYAPRDS